MAEVARTYGKGRERMAVEIEDAHGCPLEKARRWRVEGERQIADLIRENTIFKGDPK